MLWYFEKSFLGMIANGQGNIRSRQVMNIDGVNPYIPTTGVHSVVLRK